MNLVKILEKEIIKALEKLVDKKFDLGELSITTTRKEFNGDYTLLVFSLVRLFRKKPEEVGQIIGEQLVKDSVYIQDFNVIKGFLNLVLSNKFWIEVLGNVLSAESFGKGESKSESVLVEFSSPNTNKPLHLGHIRNILLGWSVSNILEMAGYDVITTQIVNDRGIAICKSMLAWQKWGGGQTPVDAGKKGDFFVGDFYVKFDKEFKKEYAEWQKTDEAAKVFEEKSEGASKEHFFEKYKNQYFNEYSQLGREAKGMLLKWEKNDGETADLWQNMNKWVLDGFDETYDRLGVKFTKSYFESQTYLEGKKIVDEGMDKGVFYKEEDGSVWIDLADIKMDKKIVLRADGTALYITQDIGTADRRYEDFRATKVVYVVGNEQDYHFRVLFEIMKRLGREYAEGMYHLSYGMVELPMGRMKSREGTVVDADDLINEVIAAAKLSAEERGQLQEVSEEEREDIYRKIGLAALKFFILKVNPRRTMVFNPEESVELQGQTGPYIQNAFVRVNSIMRKAGVDVSSLNFEGYNEVNDYEKVLIKSILDYPEVIQMAAAEYEPSLIANYAYELAKNYHKFYAEVRVLSAEDEVSKNFRLSLSKVVGDTIAGAMALLGIEMPDRM